MRISDWSSDVCSSDLQCIPGCEEIERTGDDGFTAKVSVKVGPVKAKFTGAVTLSDIDPPNGYTLSGEGNGGAAGFAKGGATLRPTQPEGGADTAPAHEGNATALDEQPPRGDRPGASTPPQNATQ